MMMAFISRFLEVDDDYAENMAKEIPGVDNNYDTTDLCVLEISSSYCIAEHTACGFDTQSGQVFVLLL